jgi:hypothetical protein
MPYSNALQQELSDQLAHITMQLKRNMRSISQLLARDQAVVDEVQGKIKGKFHVMQKERLRARDLRGKTGSTTCLVRRIYDHGSGHSGDLTSCVDGSLYFISLEQA